MNSKENQSFEPAAVEQSEKPNQQETAKQRPQRTEEDLSAQLYEYHERLSHAWFNKAGVAKQMLDDPDGYTSTLVPKLYAARDKVTSFANSIRGKEAQVDRHIRQARKWEKLTTNCDRLLAGLDAETERNETLKQVYASMLENRSWPGKIWDKARGTWGVRHLMAAGDWALDSDVFSSYSGRLHTAANRAQRLEESKKYIDAQKSEYHTKLSEHTTVLDQEQASQKEFIETCTKNINLQLEPLFNALRYEGVNMDPALQDKMLKTLLYPGISRSFKLGPIEQKIKSWPDLIKILESKFQLPKYILRRVSQLNNLGILTGRKIGFAQLRQHKISEK